MSQPDRSPLSQAGLRYIPDLSAAYRIGENVYGATEVSLNVYSTMRLQKNQPTEYASDAKPYRLWVRLAGDRFEARAGLQKISFGPGMMLRSMMWFDRIDPRDPLLLTDGVYGVLLRYYFPGNANIWLWGLYGNDGTKGWENEPTKKHTPELGGRFQLPLGAGELAATYHHRTATVNGADAPENRFGLDGKWDIGIGLWFEAALVHQVRTNAGDSYSRFWTLGADYTFDLGNGLAVLFEQFRAEAASKAFGSGSGAGLSALSASYPMGIVDRASMIVYRDWTHDAWYRILTWQRTYDNWSFYILGFLNPEQMQVYRAQNGNPGFGGTGFQLMVVFNH